MRRIVGTGILAAFLAAATAAQTPETTRAAGVARRGDHVMGFDHAKTAHHFRLTRTGGKFLRFQIDDHKTGDSKKVVPDSTQ